VTQPTLSAGIAKLEGLLGQHLFDRQPRRVRLTDAGTRFAEHARRIEAEFNAAERAALDVLPRKLIRIGVGSTVATSWLQQALAAARTPGERERIEIVEGRSNDLQAKLERGRLDALLGPVGPDHHAADTLFDEPYGVAMARTHPLAGREAVSAEDLAGETMIVRRHCEALPLVSRFFTARGVRPFMAARTISDDRAAAYVAAGLGITVMPRSLMRDDMAMPRLSGFDHRRTIGVVIPDAGRARLLTSDAYAAIAATLRTLAAAG